MDSEGTYIQEAYFKEAKLTKTYPKIMEYGFDTPSYLYTDAWLQLFKSKVSLICEYILDFLETYAY